MRYSIENPHSYLNSNLIGTFDLLEAARARPPKHMLLASTSSAYDAIKARPYQETQRAYHQMSFYAATKKSTKAMAHSYARLYQLPITMFRFLAVYGPWGRPNMAPFKFTDAILNDQTIDVYSHGNMRRDFTYVNDLVQALILLIETPPSDTTVTAEDSLSPVAPHRVLNIGNNAPVALKEFISAIAAAIGRSATRNLMDMQAGDVPGTWADTSLLQALPGCQPKTNIQTGIRKFVDWYNSY